jgi:hypothetical protein
MVEYLTLHCINDETTAAVASTTTTRLFFSFASAQQGSRLDREQIVLLLFDRVDDVITGSAVFDFWST